MRNKIVIIVLSLLALSFGVYFNSDQPLQSSVAVINTQSTIVDQANYRAFVPAKSIANFSLMQDKGKNFSQQNLQQKWTFVLLGYSSCPDVCPTALMRMKSVYGALKESGDVQVLFVSVDPLRDDITRLSKYVAYFDDEFVALSNSHDKLFPFAQNLYLPYGIVATKPADNYAVRHSAAIALLNPQGKLHGHFKAEHALGEVPSVDMKKMASNFKTIVAAYEKQML